MKNVLRWGGVGILAAAVIAAVVFFVPSYMTFTQKDQLQLEVPSNVRLNLAPMPQMTVGDDTNVFHPIDPIDPQPKIVDEIIYEGGLTQFDLTPNVILEEKSKIETLQPLPYAMEEGTPPPPPVAKIEDPKKEIIPAVSPDKRPKIAIIIDDMGLNMRLSKRALRLPKEVTLAYLPYASHLKKQTNEAHQDGHELMLHFPMEPQGTQNPGPDALFSHQSVSEWEKVIAKNLGSFDNFVGVNNHMGSQFTTNSTGLAFVAHALSRRGLFFIDSRTTAKSVVPKVMKVMDVKTASRDVFLDHVVKIEAIRKELTRAEQIATRRGQVIVIGHPHPETLQVLEAWTKKPAFKDFRLVPVRELVK